MEVTVWNEAKTIGIVLNFEDPLDSKQLAYELRKGNTTNSCGLMDTCALMEGWGELTAFDNCTIEDADDANRMRWLLKQMLEVLPARRDWMDPAVEREARDYASEWTPDRVMP